MNLANRITLLRVIMMPAFMVIIYCQWPSKEAAQAIAAAVFTIAALTDILDGYISRKRNEVTSLGKFMDPIADKLLVTGALLILVEMGRLHSSIAVLILAREFAVSGLRMVAASEGIVIAANAVAKAKTTVQDIMIVMLLIDNFPFRYWGIPMDTILVAAAVILTIYSGADYMFKYWKGHRTKKEDGEQA